MKRFLNNLLSNPLVVYYVRYFRNVKLMRAVVGVSIGRNASVVGSSLSEYVAIGDDVSLVNCKIGRCTYLSKGGVVAYTEIGKFCSIGPDLRVGLGRHPTSWVSTHPIFYSDLAQCGVVFRALSIFEEQRLTIVGNDVWIGARVTIMDGVKIGDGAIIAAGAVVTRDVAPYSVVAGVPARHIRFRCDPVLVEKIQAIAWWDWPLTELEGAADMFIQEPEIFVRHFSVAGV